jgi:hypothetical protein
MVKKDGELVSEDLADDLMVGVKPIAKFTGLQERVIFHLAPRGHLPLFKIGGRWAARKSTLRQHLAKLEQAAGAR